VFDDISLTQVTINFGNGGSRRLHDILKVGHPSIQRGNQNGFVHVKNSEKGVKRRSTILSVFASLKCRMEQFSLAKLSKVVFDAYAKGPSLFSIVKPKNQKMTA